MTKKNIQKASELSGWRGHFNRVYDVPCAITKFLSEIFVEVLPGMMYENIKNAGESIVVTDNGFATLVTEMGHKEMIDSFELISHYKFANLDKKCDKSIRKPSFKKMIDEYCIKDNAVVQARREASMTVKEKRTEVPEKWESKLRENRYGYKTDDYNLELVLRYDDAYRDKFGLNEFTNMIEKFGPLQHDIERGWGKEKYDPVRKTNKYERNYQLTEHDLRMIRLDINERYSMRFSDDRVIDALFKITNERQFHPIKQFIEEEEWDGIERNRYLLYDYFGVDQHPYYEELIELWLRGAVARIYFPGIKFSIMPIVHGKQGLGKSSFVEQLSGSFDGLNVFSDGLSTLDGSNKDDQLKTAGSWIIEVAEMDAFNSSKAEAIKRFISTNKDSYRAPYGRLVEDHLRQAVFWGTTNDSEFLKDKTGNRRFPPILSNKDKQKKHPLDGSLSAIMHQVWAEAKYKMFEVIEKNEKLVLAISDENRKYMERLQKQVMRTDMTEQLVEEFMEIEVPEEYYSWGKEKQKTYMLQHLYDRPLTLKGTNYHKRRVVTTREIIEIYILNHELNGNSSNQLMRRVGIILGQYDGYKKVENLSHYGSKARGYRLKAE